MTAAAHPARACCRVLLLAALTVVLALLMPAAPASAATLPAAETRVGASGPATAVVVGVHECITAGQRPVRGPSQPQVVAGNCVAAEARGASRGGPGDEYARSVSPGGRPDGETVFAGHGSYESGVRTTTVPEGTTLKVYSPQGDTIYDSVGRAIERGTGPAPYEVFGPGQAVPNYNLRAPKGLDIMSGSTTVQDPTSLSQLLRPNMGVCHWAACTELFR